MRRRYERKKKMIVKRTYQERLPYSFLQNLPEGAIAAMPSPTTRRRTSRAVDFRDADSREVNPREIVSPPRGGDADDPGGGVTLARDDSRPSPVQVTRVFGGGMQVRRGRDRGEKRETRGSGVRQDVAPLFCIFVSLVFAYGLKRRYEKWA